MSRNPLLPKAQIDRLGERLRKGEVTEDGLTLLDAYRRSFADAYENTIRIVRSEVELEPTGRPAKSTTSIIDKLRRESIRLTQIQDIAGCRLVVADLATQEKVSERLGQLFEKSSVVDRRIRPSHGYRAVHVIASVGGKPVEVQIRTVLQHMWAELSEKLSDVFDPAIKYGGGPSDLRGLLLEFSADIARFEDLERGGSRSGVHAMKQQIREGVDQLLAQLATLRESTRDIPD